MVFAAPMIQSRIKVAPARGKSAIFAIRRVCLIGQQYGRECSALVLTRKHPPKGGVKSFVITAAARDSLDAPAFVASEESNAAASLRGFPLPD